VCITKSIDPRDVTLHEVAAAAEACARHDVELGSVAVGAGRTAAVAAATAVVTEAGM